MAFLNVLCHFAEFGHKVTIIAVRSNKISKPENSKLRIISVPMRPIPFILPVMFMICMLIYLPFFIAISSPDFIIMDPYVHILSAFPQILISKIKKIKSVLDVRSVPVEIIGFRGWLVKFWFNVSIFVSKKFFDGMTILTKLMRDDVCNTFNINPCSVGVWPSGVDTEFFNPVKHAAKGISLKKRLGLSDRFVVFYHGVITATRGIEEIVESIKVLKHEYPEIMLFLLGAGSAVSKLRQIIHVEGLQNYVIIHDPVEYVDVPKFISMSDVGLVPLPNHPYWRFQSPLKLLEYLAMEKVVVLTDIPAHRVIVGEAKCGIYFSSREPMEIAEVIKYAYLNRDTLKERGQLGREIVKREYDWEKVAKSLENYILSINN